MIFMKDEPAWSTWQIKDVVLCSLAATDQAEVNSDDRGYCAQMHVRQVHQN
jgi:hypothetical protein